MRKFFVFITIVLVAILGCTQEETPGDSIQTKTTFDADDLFLFIKTNDPSYEELLSYAQRRFSDFERSDLSDNNVVTLYFANGKDFSYDMEGATIQNDIEFVVDTLALKHLTDSLNTMYQWYDENDGSNSNFVPTKSSTQNTTEHHAKTVDVFLWCPELSFAAADKGNSSIKGYKEVVEAFENTTYNSSVYVSSLTDINEYDIAILSCHGDEYGRIIIPQIFFDELDKLKIEGHPLTQKIINEATNKEEIRYARAIDYREMKKLFPKEDLSHTIIWTSMCYAGSKSSELRRLCLEKNCADFYGADDTCCTRGPLRLFNLFFPRYMEGMPSSWAFSPTNSESENVAVNMIHLKDTGEDEKGNKYFLEYNYCRPGDRDIYLGFESAKKYTFVNGKYMLNVGKRRPKGYDSTPYYIRTKSGEDYPIGLCLENLTDGTVLYYPLTNLSQTRDFKYISIDNYVVSAGALRPSTDYRYYCYFTDDNDNKIPEGRAYVFTTEEADTRLDVSDNSVTLYSWYGDEVVVSGVKGDSITEVDIAEDLDWCQCFYQTNDRNNFSLRIQTCLYTSAERSGTIVLKGKTPWGDVVTKTINVTQLNYALGNLFFKFTGYGDHSYSNSLGGSNNYSAYMDISFYMSRSSNGVVINKIEGGISGLLGAGLATPYSVGDSFWPLKEDSYHWEWTSLSATENDSEIHINGTAFGEDARDDDYIADKKVYDYVSVGFITFNLVMNIQDAPWNSHLSCSAQFTTTGVDWFEGGTLTSTGGYSYNCPAFSWGFSR